MLGRTQLNSLNYHLLPLTGHMNQEQDEKQRSESSSQAFCTWEACVPRVDYLTTVLHTKPSASFYKVIVGFKYLIITASYFFLM